MNKIRIGVLSSANIAKRSIIPEILNLKEQFEFIGIASRNLEKAVEVAESFSASPFGSYEELIDPLKVDALYIPLPNALHYQYAKMALEKGIHVLVEKSLGLNLQEVSDLVNLARSKNVLLMENFQFRTHSQLAYLKELISNKAIGELRHLKAIFCFPPFPDSENIRYKKELGGGALLDAGAYTVKISTLLLGNDLKVEAANLNNSKEFEVDIWGSAYLKDENTGIGASCVFGFDNYYQCGVEIIGSKGKITTNRLFTAREDYEPIFEIEVNGKEKLTKVLKKDNHFRNMLLSFHRNITDTKAKEEENTQNLIQADLIQAINEKARR